MKLLKLICALGVTALLATGCSKTDSENIKTAGIYATFSVTGNNSNSAVCAARLQVGGSTGTYMDLSGGDSITCEGQAMARSEFAGIVTYTTNVPYIVGKTYTVVLTRAGEGDYSSSVVLPAAITGTVPSVPTSYQKASVISPTWTASTNGTDNMYIELSYNYGTGNRMVSHSDSAPENGNGVVFNAADTSVYPPGAAGNWGGSLKFQRVRLGTLSGSLSGSITAAQELSVTVTLTD